MFLETWNFKDHKKISLAFSVSLSVSLLDPLRIMFLIRLLKLIRTHLHVKCYVLFSEMCNGVIGRAVDSKIK